MQWSRKTNGTYKPIPGETGDTLTLSGLTAGSYVYRFTYNVEGYYKSVDFTVTVEKATVQVTTAPTAVLNLVYTGENQTLILPGTADKGTMYYTIGRNGNHSTELPTAYETNGSYPTGMRVYRILREKDGARLEEIPEFQNLLQYAGCSIRLTGTKGIRMITALDGATKAALTGAGLAGFTLEEYGTVVAKKSSLGDNDLTLETGKHNYAYKKGVSEPVFGDAGNLTQYTNAKVEVLEDLEDCYYVNYNGKTGFLPASQLSRYPYTPPAEGGSSDSSGGASGGGGPQDGGDISLRAVGTLRLLAEGEKTGTANVKVDGVPLILRFCTLGETVRVLDGETAPAGYTAVLESEGKAYVPTDWLENAQTFTPWEGYAGSNCGLYASFQLTGTPEKTIYANSKLTVLWTAGEVSLVQVDSARYYARTATLTKTPIQMTPTPEAPASEGTGEELWTPPVM